MADTIAQSSLHISSEHASAVACSAFCYDIRKDVWIVPVIMAIRKLRQVQRQVILRDIVKGPNDATLEQAPERLNVIRVHVPAHIFTSSMTHRGMREGAAKMMIGFGL